MTDLKPCPFCGCEMECRLMHDVNTYGFPMRYFIVGDHEWECFLEHVPMVPYDNKEGAISTWNRRVTGSKSLRDTMKRYREKCGEPVVDDRMVE